jgi:hypothetical protein
VTLEIEIAGVGEPPSRRAFTVADCDDLFQQPHRRLMRQAIDQRHQRVV